MTTLISKLRLTLKAIIQTAREVLMNSKCSISRMAEINLVQLRTFITPTSSEEPSVKFKSLKKRVWEKMFQTAQVEMWTKSPTSKMWWTLLKHPKICRVEEEEIRRWLMFWNLVQGLMAKITFQLQSAWRVKTPFKLITSQIWIWTPYLLQTSYQANTIFLKEQPRLLSNLIRLTKRRKLNNKSNSKPTVAKLKLWKESSLNWRPFTREEMSRIIIMIMNKNSKKQRWKTFFWTRATLSVSDSWIRTRPEKT